MTYHCRRCVLPNKYSTDIKHHFRSHLGRIDDNHNMGPWVCQVPGCHVRAVRRGSADPHDSHPGVNSVWDKDDALAEAIEAELEASQRPAPVAPSAAGPAGLTSAGTNRYGPTPPYPPGPAGTFWLMTPNGSYTAVSPPSMTAGSSQSTTAPTIAAALTTTETSSTTTAPFAVYPALLAMNGANHATPNNHNHGPNHGASTHGQNHHHNNNNEEGPSSASAPLTILAHGEDENDDISDSSESSREYLMRTGVTPLVMEAMKLLALADPPVEKPLLWAGKWLEARSREIEGLDEEEGEKENVEVDEGKVKKEDEEEDETEVKKESEHGGEKEDEKEENDIKNVIKNDDEKDVEKDDKKDVEVEGEKDEQETESK